MTTHKWGTILLLSIREQTFPGIPVLENIQDFSAPTVIFGRNVYDSIVSGYLYHKTGRECWLDHFGRPHNIWPRNDWLLRVHIDGYNQTLCEILQGISEHKGLEIYTDFAWKRFLNKAFTVFTTQQRFKSIIICMEDVIMDYRRQIENIQNFTGQKNKIFALPPVYKGHLTSKNKTLRKRLYDIVHKIDEDRMGLNLSRLQNIVNCSLNF